MPRLSFVVPVFKPDILIFDKCVKSLADQSFKEFEAIFVLDGPCPEARSVLSKFHHKLDMTIVEIEHGGAPKARNAGAKKAQGEFIVFWDSDCAIEPGASRVWIEIFDKKPEVGLVYAGYKFFGNQYGIESEAWDPWTLRIRNYISGCFPIRKELLVEWAEDLKSLQDWDFWLSVLERAESLGKDLNTLGHFVKGYAFSTSFPTGDSISAQGCLPENWLGRMDAVKKRHNIPDRSVCVSSIQYKHEGIRLAKMIGADYQDIPNDKPNRYQTIIQVGFSLVPGNIEKHAHIFKDYGIKKFLFWTGDNINEIYGNVSFEAIDAYASLLNLSVTQFVEDKRAEALMTKAGFKVTVMPMPLINDLVPDFNDEAVYAVDCDNRYGEVMIAVEKSLPDIKIEMLNGQQPLSKYRGLLHFFSDRSMSNTVKRAIITGRHVVTNIQQPFCGFVDDKGSREAFVEGVVKRVRDSLDKTHPKTAIDYYTKTLSPKKLLGVIGA